eukprot:CAMPEP_0176274384 /NCGR_PEP_ID=MMETSP0121_2-20121125/46699_1 /TAXON_ID=160619 /ORGANISM="Kryptoperidinium foliaceum, Strain CCMP 1326" /LENGTH=194 /DNA_ID=CAMNT_0017614581 /DNA_START=212 /DNA_END=794 /DNA_ORIENTATION=+
MVLRKKLRALKRPVVSTRTRTNAHESPSKAAFALFTSPSATFNALSRATGAKPRSRTASLPAKLRKAPTKPNFAASSSTSVLKSMPCSHVPLPLAIFVDALLSVPSCGFTSPSSEAFAAGLARFGTEPTVSLCSHRFRCGFGVAGLGEAVEAAAVFALPLDALLAVPSCGFASPTSPPCEAGLARFGTEPTASP